MRFPKNSVIIKIHVYKFEFPERRDKELMKGPWGQRNLDLEADMLIPVEDTETGVIIVGGETIVYHYGQDYICIQPSFMRTTKMSCYCRIDNNRSLLF